MPAKSKRQQRAAGVALAAKRGQIPISHLKSSSKRMYENMTEEQISDFAKGRQTKKKYKVLHRNN